MNTCVWNFHTQNGVFPKDSDSVNNEIFLSETAQPCSTISLMEA